MTGRANVVNGLKFWIGSSLIGLLLTFSLGVRGAEIEKRDLSAVVISGNLRLGIVRDGAGWKVSKLASSFEIREPKQRQLRLPPTAMSQLEKCFVERKCISKVDLGPGEVDDLAAQLDAVGLVSVHRLSDKFAAVTKPSSVLEQVFFLDLGSGQVFDFNAPPDRVLAFAGKLGGVYFSDCPPASDACDIGFLDFGGSSKAFIRHLEGRIWDLRADGDRVLVLLAKNTKPSPGLLDRVFGALGHPPSRQEWFIATVDSRQEVTESKLTGELVNAWGRFVCKWCDVDE